MIKEVLLLTVLVLSEVNAGTKQMGEEPKYEFPDTLEGLGYRFNEEGQLRSIETDEPYEFEAKKGDHSYNQKRYNALGDVITEHIYKLMEKECKLQKTQLPADAEENEPTSFVFISGDLYTNEDKLLLLIHGSGAVRAGQWARRLIINDSLKSGSQLPYIKWARENGYAVVIANTNINAADILQGARKKKDAPKIRGNSSPEEHTESIWHEFVQRARAKNIAIVAHSYGGVCLLQLAMKHIREFEERVFAIALTDSVHSFRQQEATPEVKEFYKERAVNWASAYDPLDAPLQTETNDTPTVSAGTDKHEYTSYSAMESIFTYLTEKYEQRDPTKKRVAMGEPHNAHYHRPTSSETQHLMSRSRGEGEESVEQPAGQTANQNVANEVSQSTEKTGEGDGKVIEDETKKSDSDVKSDNENQTTEDQVPNAEEEKSDQSKETKDEVMGKSEL